MLWRPVRDIDLEACLDIEPRHLGAELVGQQKALAAWRWMLRSPAFEGAVFELETPDAGCEIVGFGAAAFVLSSFVNDEVENPQPGLNARIVASIVDHRPVLLDYEQLREENTNSQLQLVVLSSIWKQPLDAVEMGEGIALMGSVFVRHFIGYRISRILYEAIGENEVKVHDATGVSRFVRKYDDDRALSNITRESAFSLTGSSVSTLFVDRLPALRLTEADQRLLRAALDELTDEDLAQQLRVHVGGVKKRWSKIFDRISDVRPDILFDCHDSTDGRTRGKQKRHRVLAYIREHPEELRPFDYSHGTHQSALHRRGIIEDAPAG
jgi:hypothetical protein